MRTSSRTPSPSVGAPARRSRIAALGAILASATMLGGLAAAAPVPAYAQPTPAALPAAPADATKDGATTKVTVAKSMVSRLHKAGIKLTGVGPTTVSSSKGKKVLSFPTASVDPNTRELLHSGGVSFSKKKTKLKLTKLTFSPNDKVLRATINGDAKADVLRATLGTQATDAVQLKLNKLLARLLNSDGRTHRFKAGQVFGTLRLPEELGTTTTASMTINVTNNSHYTLDYSSVDTNGMGHLTSTPASVLRPGQVDTITYTSSNSHGGEVKLTYRIDGSEKLIDTLFQVPLVGTNTAECPQDAWVDYNYCHIDRGYSPTVSWTVSTNTATGPITDLTGSGAGYWAFHLIGAPGNKQIQVMGASSDNGAQVALWDALDAGNYQWRFVPTTGGWGQLRNVNSGRCLEVNGSDGSVDQWDCTDGADNQLWQPVLNPSGGSALQVKSSSEYITASADPGSVSNGTTLVMDANLSNRNSWAGQD